LDSSKSNTLAIFDRSNIEILSEAPIEAVEAALNQAPPSYRKLARKYALIVGKNLVSLAKAVLTPPFIALMLGLFIGCVTPLKTFFVTSPPAVVSSIMHVAKVFSGAAFPLIMVVLGINLYTTLYNIKTSLIKDYPDPNTRTLKQMVSMKIIKHNHPVALMLCVVLRLIIIPGIGIGIVVASAYAGIISRDDPIMLLVLLVEASTPSANNLSTLCSIHEGAGQDQMSEILLLMYACAPFTLGLLAGGYMFLIEHMETS
jgi:hypothetical protein